MVTKFVYCHQPGLGLDPPFLAEYLTTSGGMAYLKVGKKKIKAKRDACSRTPYTQAELDKHLPTTKPVSETARGFFQ